MNCYDFMLCTMRAHLVIFTWEMSFMPFTAITLVTFHWKSIFYFKFFFVSFSFLPKRIIAICWSFNFFFWLMWLYVICSSVSKRQRFKLKHLAEKCLVLFSVKWPPLLPNIVSLIFYLVKVNKYSICLIFFFLASFISVFFFSHIISYLSQKSVNAIILTSFAP